MAEILIIGAGIVGLWQAVTLGRAGHHVRLIERSQTPFEDAASRIAGAMLAPFCEGEGAEPIITELGRESLPLWRALYPETCAHGSLVVAQPRDLRELQRFARMTNGFEQIDSNKIAELEPALAGSRYGQGLFYAEEAHIEPARAMAALLDLVRDTGATLQFGMEWDETALARDEAAQPDFIIDCRGMGARGDLPKLRGVRGEMAVIETNEISLRRPVRLLHPRFPLYVVPWPGNRFMVGSTVIESSDRGPATVRSALDILGLAYTLHPSFGEARIASFAADLRPSFPDNLPKIILRGRHIYVNGVYRHGFLLAPSLAQAVAHYIERGCRREDLFVEYHR